MRILHQEFVEGFNFDLLDGRHVPGLERAIASSQHFARIHDFKVEIFSLLAAAKENGDAGSGLVPGFALVIEWFEHSNRISILRDELGIILKIAKGRPVPVSSAQDKNSRD